MSYIELLFVVHILCVEMRKTKFAKAFQLHIRKQVDLSNACTKETPWIKRFVLASLPTIIVWGLVASTKVFLPEFSNNMERIVFVLVFTALFFCAFNCFKAVLENPKADKNSSLRD